MIGTYLRRGLPRRGARKYPAERAHLAWPEMCGDGARRESVAARDARRARNAIAAGPRIAGIIRRRAGMPGRPVYSAFYRRSFERTSRAG